MFGTGLGGGVAPGSLKGCQLVVDRHRGGAPQLEAAGIENTGPQHFAEGGVMTPGVEPNRADYGTFIYFDDPDGNTWAVQEIKQHAR